jgi:Na+-transporting methylmalonyl-CoA/oxaloacetate decarboxylase gamma subunit
MSSLSIPLQITALGIGLVFAAIILLWWMMALLTNLTTEKEKEGDASLTPGSSLRSVAQSPPRREEKELQAQAAAIAVAMAMAEQQTSQAHLLSLPPTAIVSAWQLGMRIRQMYQKGTPIVRNPRKIG